MSFIPFTSFWRRRKLHTGDMLPEVARRMVVGLVIGVLAGAATVGWSRLPWAGHDGFEALTFDRRVAAHRSTGRPEIVIVEINESTIQNLARLIGRWPWPRAIHAGAVNYLARAGARTVIYDVLFTEADLQGIYRIGDRTVTGPESDDALITAIRRAGNVILLADATFEGMRQRDANADDCPKPEPPGTVYAPAHGLVDRPCMTLPFPALRDAAAGVGHNFHEIDSGGVSRALHPFVRSQGVAVPSLGLAAVLAGNTMPAEAVRSEPGTLVVGDMRIPLRDNGQALLWPRGPYASEQGDAFKRYSFFDVLLSEERASAGQPPAIPESEFAGKIVFIGTTATSLGDVYSTAFEGGAPGAFLQATLTDNVLANRFMRPASQSSVVAYTIAAGIVAGVIALTLPVWWAIPAIGVASLAFVFAATRAVGSGWWMPLVAPLAAATASTVGGLAWQFFVEGRAKREVKRLFSRYVSPDIVQELMNDPSIARLGGERREMTVLFSDIRGFTSVSEAGSPESIVLQLNEYFTEMVDVLFKHRGTLDKFVGDMVMGLFGAPVRDPRHADSAVAAAIDMSRSLDRLNARWVSEGRPKLEIGIGINTGEMIAGNIGSEAIMSYTVIGDAVNLGSRIESLNKDFGTRILISQATKDRLTTAVSTRRVAEVNVKGRREPVTVYEVSPGPPGPSGPSGPN